MFKNEQYQEELKNATRPPTPEEEVVEEIEAGDSDKKTIAEGEEAVVEPGEKKTVPTDNVVEPIKRSAILNLLSKLTKAKPKDDKKEKEKKTTKGKKKKKKQTKSVNLKKAKTKLKKWYKRLIIFLNSIKALFSRVLYVLHVLITVWRVTVVLGDWYWVVISWLGFMIFELMIVIFQRGGREFKWIQPCILIYLIIELPSIWLLELYKVSELQIERNASSVLLGDLVSLKDENGPALQITALDVITNDFWALLLEQSMLVLIIIARWLMPKGDMNRDQLSALLLFYLGTASDIVDFFSVISEDEELSTTNYTFLFTILGFWSWSMFQFVFLVTMTKSEGEADGEEEDDSGDDSDLDDEEKSQMTKKLLSGKDKLTFKERLLKNTKIFLASEAWSIMISMIFQDGPYAAVRVVCLFHWNIRTYTNYFFTAKNIMVLLLQIYRLVAVYEEYKTAKKEAKKKKREARRELLQSSVKRVTFASRLLGGLRNRKKDSSGTAEESGAAPPLAHTVQLHNLHAETPNVKTPCKTNTWTTEMSASASAAHNASLISFSRHSRHLIGSSGQSQSPRQPNAARTKQFGVVTNKSRIGISVSESVSQKEDLEQTRSSPGQSARTLGGLSMSKSISHGDCVIELGALTGFDDLRGQNTTSQQQQGSHDLGVAVAELNVPDLSHVSVV